MHENFKGGRMDGTRMVWWRESWIAKLGRKLSGDWWLLETKDGKFWGVWHPWRRHYWENYRLTKEEATKEQSRRNSGFDYQICEHCGYTYASHKSHYREGIYCP